MNRNPIQARMLCIRTLQNDMLEHLYNQQKRKVIETMNKIAIINQPLVKGDTPTFYYNGFLYGSAIQNSANNKIINKKLHPTLQQQVCDLIHKPSFDAIAIKTHINHMFSIILSKTKHIDDVKKLLPSAFLSYIQKVDPEIFNTGDLLSDKEITDIKEKTKTSIGYINELCLIRLLLINK